MLRSGNIGTDKKLFIELLGRAKSREFDADIAVRIVFITNREAHQPDHVAIESVFVSRGLQSALKLGHARGAAICAAVTLDLSVAEYAPRQIKQAIVGKGGAAKQQVQYMVGMLLNIKKPIQEDAADALAVAICHQHYSESAKPLESVMQAGAGQ